MSITSPHHRRRRAKNNAAAAFTLVELLAVIAIVGILMAVVLGIAPGISNARNEAAAKSHMGSIQTALEEFHQSYKEYPPHDGAATDAEGWQKTLYATLTGLKVLKFEDDKYRLATYEEAATSTGKTAVQRSFIRESAVGTQPGRGGEEIPEEQRYFVDPWGNPYGYRYNILENGAFGKQWRRPGYLLVCAGIRFRDHDAQSQPSNEDYFSGAMETTGQVPDEYFKDEYRRDNLTNWKPVN
ncbi:MAG: prepilin-type N-terminal cleavage/methylation domain-containing protein [Puniceicoccales bacterium]|jgi:prepilin-type N-terminal cleavage/methylation domain-containing protein|nr:prepilin-type N-terminal cleavage/methylation domain-containing protein [Puniceicoccales bacterium]